MYSTFVPFIWGQMCTCGVTWSGDQSITESMSMEQFFSSGDQNNEGYLSFHTKSWLVLTQGHLTLLQLSKLSSASNNIVAFAWLPWSFNHNSIFMYVHRLLPLLHLVLGLICRHSQQIISLLQIQQISRLQLQQTARSQILSAIRIIALCRSQVCIYGIISVLRISWDNPFTYTVNDKNDGVQILIKKTNTHCSIIRFTFKLKVRWVKYQFRMLGFV